MADKADKNKLVEFIYRKENGETSYRRCLSIAGPSDNHLMVDVTDTSDAGIQGLREYFHARHAAEAALAESHGVVELLKYKTFKAKGVSGLRELP